MNKIAGYAGYVAFGMALIATLSSLYLSEILHWTPCILCWYQRILMYPLVLIIGIAVIRRDNNWPITTLALASIGWLVALYHSLLQWGIVPSSLAPCTVGESCLVRHTAWFGFITIPFLSWVAFTVIIVMALIFWKGVTRDKRI